MSTKTSSPIGTTTRIRSPSLSDRIHLFQQQNKEEPNGITSPNQPLKRKLNYNSVRPLPSQSREDIVIASHSSDSNAKGENVNNESELRREMEEEFKKREEALKSQMRQVLIRVKEERTQLHQLCNKYKTSNNEYATRILRLENMMKLQSNPSTPAESPNPSPSPSVVSPPPSPFDVNRSRSSSLSDSGKLKEIADLNKKLNATEESLKAEKEKNQKLTKQLEELKLSKSTSVEQPRTEPKINERVLANTLSEIQRIMSERDAEMMRILRRELVPLSSSQNHINEPVVQQENPRAAVQKSRSLGGDELANLHREKMMRERNSLPNLMSNPRVRKDRPTLLALYDYFPSSPDDLQFSEGDLLILHDKGPNGWWLAEMGGKIGKIPCNFITDLENCPRIEMIAKSDFVPETESDLSMKQGEKLIILNQEDDWWIGENSSGSIGYIPRNYLVPFPSKTPATK